MYIDRVKFFEWPIQNRGFNYRKYRHMDTHSVRSFTTTYLRNMTGLSCHTLVRVLNQHLNIYCHSSMSWPFFVFSEFKWDVMVHIIDIGGHHCLKLSIHNEYAISEFRKVILFCALNVKIPWGTLGLWVFNVTISQYIIYIYRLRDGQFHCRNRSRSGFEVNHWSAVRPW
jgi:hypothetical protein